MTLIKIARPAINLSVKTDVYSNITEVKEKKTQAIQKQSTSPSLSKTDDLSSVPVAKTEMKILATVTSPKKSEVKSLMDQSKRSVNGPLLPPELLKQLKEELTKEKAEETEERAQFSGPVKDDIEGNVTSGLVIRKQNKKKNSKKNPRNLEVLLCICYFQLNC